jgi:hypothetical protein
MDPNGRTPLAGVVELETDEAVQAQLRITDGNDLWTVSFPDASYQHYLFFNDTATTEIYTVDIVLIPGGRVGTVFATTAPLPADFPTLVTIVSDPAEMAPGYTLTDCLSRADTDTRPDYSVIVDSAGEVVWYTNQCYKAALQLLNGRIFYREEGEVVEMDMLGNDKRVPLDVPGLGLHHDLLRTPHGTYLSLTRQTVDVPDFPTSETDPDAPTGPATLRDDSVVEFLPDGTLRREWPLVDMLDLTRIGFDSLRETNDGLDWTHSNAVNYRLDDDSIIVSVRHQDAVIKFLRETGNLEWILGPHDNWSSEFEQFLLHPVGSEFRWQFHQHAPMWTGDGTLLLFDNGNRKASPFDGNAQTPQDQNFSRGVEFEIDEQVMQVQQVWEYGENIAERVYSFFISDADWLETMGNRLMTFGGVSFVGGVASIDLGLGVRHARIIETSGDVKVFELWAYDPGGGPITVYRSERIPSLYPLRYVKSPNGVGNSLRMARVSGLPELSWTVSPVDSEHDAADYYMVYLSSSPAGGFTMWDSTAYTDIEPSGGAGSMAFYKLVAANTAGTSGDEPSTEPAAAPEF